jgi:hypothetical protein
MRLSRLQKALTIPLPMPGFRRSWQHQTPSYIVLSSLRLSVEAIIATQMAAVHGLAISDRNRDGLADNRSVFAATAVWWRVTA